MSLTEALPKIHFIKSNIRLRAMLMKIKQVLSRQQELGELTPAEKEMKEIVEKYEGSLP